MRWLSGNSRALRPLARSSHHRPAQKRCRPPISRPLHSRLARRRVMLRRTRPCPRRVFSSPACRQLFRRKVRTIWMLMMERCSALRWAPETRPQRNNVHCNAVTRSILRNCRRSGSRSNHRYAKMSSRSQRRRSSSSSSRRRRSRPSKGCNHWRSSCRARRLRCLLTRPRRTPLMAYLPWRAMRRAARRTSPRLVFTRMTMRRYPPSTGAVRYCPFQTLLRRRPGKQQRRMRARRPMRLPRLGFVGRQLPRRPLRSLPPPSWRPLCCGRL